MGDMTIGIALFVLIIVIGLAIGLRLSSTSPQRHAVLVAFGSMAVIAGLFYAFAMNASQLWTAPVFAIACIVVPIGAYTLMMRRAQPEKKVVSRRASNEAPKPIRSDRAARAGSILDGAVMPVAPNHPVNEYLSLQPDEDIELAEELDEAAEAEEAAEPRDIEAELVTEFSSDVTAKIGGDILADEDEFELSEDMDAAAAEESPAPATASDAGDGAEPASDAGDGAEPASDGDGEAEAPSTATEALIEEYLVEENEDEGGLFEPEAAPSLQPKKEAAPVTSTMMVTIPFSEGDERFLVVSESTSVPNPILAYKRTTSSHLVPLGSSGKRGSHVKTPRHAGSEMVAEERRPEPVEKPVFEQTSIPLDESVATERPAAPKPAARAVEPAAQPAPKPEIKSESVVAAAVAAPTAAPKPAPVASRPEPAAPTAPAPAAASKPEPAPAAPAAPQAAPVPAPKPAPTPVAPQPSPEPEATPAPAPASKPVPVVSEERFQEFLDKAQGLRDRGLYPMAARIYATAAESAPTGDARRRARFEEISCYVKAGQNDQARALAAQLRASSVLTRVERIKLDAIERMVG